MRNRLSPHGTGLGSEDNNGKTAQGRIKMCYEIHKCPHCKGESVLRIGDECVWIECQACGCRTKTFSIRDAYGNVYAEKSILNAVETWNRRAQNGG